MLGGDPGGRPVGAAKHDGGAHLSARHVQGLGRGIDDLVHGLHGEVEGHELDDGSEAGEGGADPEPGETVFGDRRVDDPFVAEFLEQPLADLVGALVLGHLLADEEDALVAPHLLGHGVTERLAHRERHGRTTGHGRDPVAGGRVALGRRRAVRHPIQVGGILAVPEQHGDGRIDGHTLGPLPDEDAREDAPRPPLPPPWLPCRSRSRRVRPRFQWHRPRSSASGLACPRSLSVTGPASGSRSAWSHIPIATWRALMRRGRRCRARSVRAPGFAGRTRRPRSRWT